MDPEWHKNHPNDIRFHSPKVLAMIQRRVQQCNFDCNQNQAHDCMRNGTLRCSHVQDALEETIQIQISISFYVITTKVLVFELFSCSFICREQGVHLEDLSLRFDLVNHLFCVLNPYGIWHSMIRNHTHKRVQRSSKRQSYQLFNCKDSG